MVNMSDDDKARLVLEVTEAIKPLLAGKGPDVQGGIIANLAAIWLVGHAPYMREEVLQGHIKVIRDLMPLSEAELFATRERPADWLYHDDNGGDV